MNGFSSGAPTRYVCGCLNPSDFAKQEHQVVWQTTKSLPPNMWCLQRPHVYPLCEDRVSQQGCESANRKARVSQPTRAARFRQPGRESNNQVASQTTRSRVSQPGRESANQVASQPTGQELANRSRVSQPVGSQPTGHQSANRSRVSQQAAKRSRVRQPGRESANQFARRT